MLAMGDRKQQFMLRCKMSNNNYNYGLSILICSFSSSAIQAKPPAQHFKVGEYAHKIRTRVICNADLKSFVCLPFFVECCVTESPDLCCRGKEDLQQGQAAREHWNSWPC